MGLRWMACPLYRSGQVDYTLWCVYACALMALISGCWGQEDERWASLPVGALPNEHARFSNATRSPSEARLVHHLLSIYESYGRVARPLWNSRQQMTVLFGLRLIKLDVSEKDQSLRSSVWVRCRWKDQYLRWNPAEFEGLNMTVLPWDRVWVPDIALVNTADTGVNIRHADIMVSSAGDVYWAPHRVFKSACLIDVTNFPYDNHGCDLWFQAMSRYSTQMDLQPYYPSSWDLDTYLDSFRESQTWSLSDNVTERFEASREAGVLLKFSRRTSLRFSITIQRKVGYTGLLLMVPCVFLGCTTLVIFWLPPDRPDRITLAMSLLASFLVLLLILVETAPPTAASIPLLGLYYASIMVLIMMSPFISGVVVHLNRRGLEIRKPVPKYIRKIFLEILTWPMGLRDRMKDIEILEIRQIKADKLGLGKPLRPCRRPTDLFTPEENLTTLENACTGVVEGGFDIGDVTTPNGGVQDVIDEDLTASSPQPLEDRPEEEIALGESAASMTSKNMNYVIHRRLSAIESQFRRIIYETRDKRSMRYSDPIYLQWKLLSQVVDRICFIIYLIVIVLSHTFFYPRPS